MPTMIPGCFGRPTMDGKTARGASSPANPALHIPEPLSTTRACTSSSPIFDYCLEFRKISSWKYVFYFSTFEFLFWLCLFYFGEVVQCENVFHEQWLFVFLYP
mmetsp:Transcript_11146/g.12772  ORF Transcript_11146/g.12772 Transcript_11146/m.12772 type:complete len:103 (+) Transcript_11146:750-1058(+)